MTFECLRSDQNKWVVFTFWEEQNQTNNEHAITTPFRVATETTAGLGSPLRLQQALRSPRRLRYALIKVTTETTTGFKVTTETTTWLIGATQNISSDNANQYPQKFSCGWCIIRTALTPPLHQPHVIRAM
jgi:hypothetical protein